MRLLPSLYRVALCGYPPAFRLRYREEMARVFDEGLRDAGTAGRRATLRYCCHALADLVAGATRERFAAMNRVSAAVTLFAVSAGVFASYIDFHASEVQATLLVLIATNFILGCAAPKGVWRGALLIAALLPAIHVAVYAFGNGDANQGHPYFSRLMMFWPALVASLMGAYAGALLRFLSHKVAQWFAPHGGPGPETMA